VQYPKAADHREMSWTVPFQPGIAANHADTSDQTEHLPSGKK
jgi:hypothetical protein